MLFNSVLFLVFFVVVYLVYWNLSGRVRQSFLICASIVFYATWGLSSEGLWGLRWTLHFLLMVGLNYWFVRMLIAAGDNAVRKKRLLATIVVINLSNLGIFKYFEFLRDILLDLGLDLPAPAREFDLFLPLAISFYTFQLIAYVVDVYRGQIEGDPGFRRFFLFILFFPQLIAGPIMRSTDFMQQLDHPWIDRRRMYDGLWIILGGLVKKVALADPMGQYVAPVYYNPEAYTGWSILAAGACFSLQVYCDFSGYTDIARGSARLLGYDIPENFRAPFFARSARELWNRWHITLATWLRDYIYIPLGGNRRGYYRTYLNLIITFTLGGLWHGADYTYVAWGAFWGLLLAVERFIETDRQINITPEKSRVLIVAKVLFMFFLFSLGALMFRAHDIPEHGLRAGEVMLQMFAGLVTHFPGSARADFIAAGGDPAFAEAIFGAGIFRLNEISPVEGIFMMFLALIFFHVVQYRPGLFERWRKYDPWLLILAGAVILGILLPRTAIGSHQFIYFVF